MIVVVMVLVFLSVFSFFAVLILWPEWLGISGDQAKKIRQEHASPKEDTPEP